MKRNILTEPELFTRNQIVGIEGHYDAAYVCETCLLGKGGGWVNAPVAVFYQDEAFRIPEGGITLVWYFPQGAQSVRRRQPNPDDVRERDQRGRGGHPGGCC